MRPLPHFGRSNGTNGASRRLQTPRHFPINLLSQADGNQTLHERDIGQRTGQVAMLGIAFLILFDGAGKVLECLLVSALAARDPAIGGMDVAAGYEIVRVQESRFRLFEDAPGFLRACLPETSASFPGLARSPPSWAIADSERVPSHSRHISEPFRTGPFSSGIGQSRS